MNSGTVLTDGRVLAVGGEGSNSVLLASAEIYNAGSATWTPTGALTTPRKVFTATLLHNGNVLVTGGWGAGDNSLKSAELYVADDLIFRNGFESSP